MPVADQAALAAQGAAVRARLASDPSAYRVPGDLAELFVITDFLTEAECARFIALIDASARPSDTYDHGHHSRYRTSWSGDVDPADPLVRMVQRRIDDLTGIDPRFGETIQGQRYREGQEFRAHHDWFYTNMPYWADEARRGGQRSWTAMAYLNDVSQGGATAFPHLGLSVQPQRGGLLVWNNARPDGLVNEATLHAAEPVEAGVKYVFTKWYRTRVWF